MIRTHDCGEIRTKDLGKQVKLAGWVRFYRDHGGVLFFDLADAHGTTQTVFDAEAYTSTVDVANLGNNLNAIGREYVISITGTVRERVPGTEDARNPTGKVEVLIEEVVVLSASKPLPFEIAEQKNSTLPNEDVRMKYRYIDLRRKEMVANLRFRHKVISSARKYLDSVGFIEVETPVLQTVAGGAAARPFVTHHNSLGADFFLRISLELYLKRLLVGGFDRVYEIGRNFRNEGISRRHNPEFTMLEVYQAYGDHRGMMILVKEMLTMLGREVLGTMKIVHAPTGEEIDLGGTWREATYKDLVCAETGDPDWFGRGKAEHAAAAAKLGLNVEPQWEDFEITNEIFSKRIEPKLIQPTFVVNLPKELCPLAKINRDDPTTLDVFELTIGGMEIAPAYSEQNDPDVQRQMFEAQAGEEKQNIDHDFLLALEHGMPPAGGMGVGIDRLCILLTGAESIRDVILFPQLRPSA